MRTRLSICSKKARFPSARDALLVAERAGVPLRPYRCDRCRHFHLTSRTKGKRTHGRHAGGMAERPLTPRPPSTKPIDEHDTN